MEVNFCLSVHQACEQAGEDLVPCEGQCCGMFHLQCLGVLLEPDSKVLCEECSTGETPGSNMSSGHLRGLQVPSARLTLL